MGCWNKTCGLSSLPIIAGEEVYVFVLEKQHSDTERCYSTAFWKPVLLPFESTYDDYGGGENSKGIALPVIIAGLKASLVEKEVGANQYHDIAVSKDNFEVEQFFEAVHENRLFVTSYYGEAMVDFVMFRKDVVDHIIENRIIEQYVGEGKGTGGYGNSYVYYKFSDIIADVPAYLDEYSKQLTESRRLLASIRDVIPWNSRHENKVAGWIFDTYNQSRIVYLSERITDLIESGQRTQAEELFKVHLMGSFIQSFMECTRKNWMPGGHEGSQGTEYAEYQLLLDATQKVITNATIDDEADD